MVKKAFPQITSGPVLYNACGVWLTGRWCVGPVDLSQAKGWKIDQDASFDTKKAPKPWIFGNYTIPLI